MTHLYFSNLKSPKSSLLFSSFSIVPLGYLGCWRNSSSDPRLWCWWVGVHGLKNTVILRSLWTSTSPQKTGFLQILFRSVAVPSSANWSGIFLQRNTAKRIIEFAIWTTYLYGCFPKIVGFSPPNPPLKNRVFHDYKPSIMGCENPLFWETPHMIFTCCITWR